MGRRGPLPKPNSLRVLHGEQLTRTDAHEPEAQAGTPEPPLSMHCEEARDIWYYTCAQLEHMGCITLADRDMLAAYCEAVAMHRRASKAIANMDGFGDEYDDAIGPTLGGRAVDWVRIQRDSASLMQKLGREFGLSPSARAGIRLPDRAPSAGGAERLLTA